MNQYKVLKEFPSSDSGFIHKEGTTYKPTQSVTRTKNLERLGYIKEVPERPNTVWDLKDGDRYYVITSDGEIDQRSVGYLHFEEEHREIGNCFLTKEGAEKELARRKARVILERDTKGFKVSRDNHEFYYVSYDIYGHSFDIGNWETECCGGELTSEINFATKEDAKASIKAHEKEWLCYLGVEE